MRRSRVPVAIWRLPEQHPNPITLYSIYHTTKGEFAMLCRHCGQRPSNRPRGLCWTCYYTPGVRDRYPSTSKFGRRGVGDFNGEGMLPPVPTHALPGSLEKVAILEERARMRQALWHPQDARADNAGR